MSNYGQLGLGFSGDSFEPGLGMEKSKVYEPTELVELRGEDIREIFCGGTFSLFLNETGEIFGCGINDIGQLGMDNLQGMQDEKAIERNKKKNMGSVTDIVRPTKMICFEGLPFSKIACGENHVIATSGHNNELLFAWGMYKNGQLGVGEVTHKIANLFTVNNLCTAQINRISCGSLHSMALVGDIGQISTLSSLYYTGSEKLTSHWTCDVRGLNVRVKDRAESGELESDEVPQDEEEAKIKYPKFT